MKLLENPLNFFDSKGAGIHKVYLKNINELGQGGPCAGTLYLDDTPLFDGKRVIAPFHIYLDNIYVALIHKPTKIQVIQFNISSKKISLLGDIKEFLWIQKVNSEKLVCFEDINRMTEYTINI